MKYEKSLNSNSPGTADPWDSEARESKDFPVLVVCLAPRSTETTHCVEELGSPELAVILQVLLFVIVYI